jgi:hypothetical protein
MLLVVVRSKIAQRVMVLVSLRIVLVVLLMTAHSVMVSVVVLVTAHSVMVSVVRLATVRSVLSMIVLVVRLMTVLRVVISPTARAAMSARLKSLVQSARVSVRSVIARLRLVESTVVLPAMVSVVTA